MTTLFRFRYITAFALLIGVGSARSLAAGELAESAGPVILEVSGAISHPGCGGA